jgi:hypothetical protein
MTRAGKLGWSDFQARIRVMQAVALVISSLGIALALLYGQASYGAEITGLGFVLALILEWIRTDR